MASPGTTRVARRSKAKQGLTAANEAAHAVYKSASEKRRRPKLRRRQRRHGSCGRLVQCIDCVSASCDENVLGYDSFRVRVASMTVACIAALALGCVAGLPQATNRDSPRMVAVTVGLAFALPTMVILFAVRALGNMVWLHLVPLIAGFLLCVTTALVVGNLVADSVFANAALVLNKLDIGLPLGAGTTHYVTPTKGVNIRMEHLVQLPHDVPSLAGNITNDTDVTCLAPVGYLGFLDRHTRGPVAMWTMCHMPRAGTRTCQDLINGDWPPGARKYPFYDEPYWEISNAGICFTEILGRASALDTMSGTLVARAPVANASDVENTLKLATWVMNTTNIAPQSMTISDKGVTRVSDGSIMLVAILENFGRRQRLLATWLMLLSLATFVTVAWRYAFAARSLKAPQAAVVV